MTLRRKTLIIIGLTLVTLMSVLFVMFRNISVKYYFLYLLTSGLVFGLAVLYLLERVVLSRLGRLSKDVNRIGAGGNLAARVSIDGDDELSSLAGSVNGMLEALERSQNELFNQRAAEEELRESEERFRRLVENAPLGILVLDLQGTVTTVNPSLVKILGPPSEDWVVGINLLTYPPFSQSGISDSIRQCMETGGIVISEHAYISKGGNFVWLCIYLTPLTRAGGKITGVLLLVEDITERKKVEEELLQKDRRIQKELQLASTIQSSLFPINLPQVPGVTLAATAVSANEVGGDYCDLFINKYNKLGIAIGDVMGKGVPAALFVAMTYAVVRNYALETEQPSAVVNRVNRVLFPQLENAQQFITFFYALYDPQTRELVYTNAGHNPPIVYRASTGECETLEVRDYFMGGILEAEYREGKTMLNPGDVVLFYTDGLKEGRNKEKEQFGMERITQNLKVNHIYDPASIQEIISCEFSEFLDGELPLDDVTMIVIKIDEIRVFA
ncbi:MAG: SpoIIE family protein phosphatase [Firmicutes bacterium]|nr:SpoIIE family protein phosphatase [Bacillota bacterium]